MNLLIFSFLFTLLPLFGSDKANLPSRHHETAAIEAIVTPGNYGCGFLLRLNDGQLIRPQNLPKKFQKNGEKVVLVIDEMKSVYNSPCLVQKEVHIADIHLFVPYPSPAKY